MVHSVIALGLASLMGFGLAALLVSPFIAVYVCLSVWWMVRILIKAGFSGWWVLVLAIPIFSIVFVWIFAFIAWPAEQKAAAVGENT